MPLIRGAGSMPAIEMTRKDLRVSQLRAAARTVDVKQARCILAIAMGLDGPSRLVAAQAGGMDRQTPRGFMHRSNSAGAALVMLEASIAAINKHLAEISQRVGVSALLILDGAGWPSSPQLIVPENIVLLPLPPSAPELNATDPSTGSGRAITESW
jgi:hypothetical protein